MKKKIITLVTLVIISVSASFAAGNDISKNVQAIFASTFENASNVQWEKYNDYYSASFQQNGKSYNALLSAEDGTIIAVSRKISSAELAADLQASLKNYFQSYWITDLVKYTMEDNTICYATIENADETVVLESNGGTDWSVMKKTVK